MMKYFLLFALSLLNFTGSILGQELERLNVNAFIDTLTSQAQDELASNYNPLALPGGRESFCKKIVFVTICGDAQFYNGKLYGLHTIHRDQGDNYVSGATLHGSLGFRSLTPSYSASASFAGVRVRASATVRITNSNIRFSASLNSDGSFRLDSFRITDLGDMDVTISGLGGLNWMLGKLSGEILNQLRPTLRNAISNQVQGVLRKEIAKINISQFFG